MASGSPQRIHTPSAQSLLLEYLLGYQVVVCTLKREELLVCATFHDLTTLHANDFIRVFYCAESMSNHDNCTALHRILKSQLYQLFVLCI